MKIIVARVMSENLLTYRKEDTKSKGKAIVIYDTLFGNTERVAEALTRGIQKHGIEVKCINIKDAAIDKLEQYNLIAVGAPTHFLRASRPMKEFLSRLEGASRNFACKYGFAFDTRYDSFMAGSAAKYIEKKLDKVGLEIIKPRTSAIVRGTNEKGKGCDTNLREGEEKFFETVGNEIGTTLVEIKKLKSGHQDVILDLSDYYKCRSCCQLFDSFGDMEKHILVEHMQEGDIPS